MSELKLVEMCVGSQYESKVNVDENGDPTTPWIDGNPYVQRQLQQNQWKRWDGVDGPARQHVAWAYERARSLTSKERDDEWRPYGERGSCRYFVHDDLTKKGDGFGLFKIQTEVEMKPKDLIARCFDMKGLADIDPTVVTMKVLKTYLGDARGDPFCAVVYWANAPGFPFKWRDGLDVSGWTVDENDTNVLWQTSVSVKGNDFQSIPGGLAATQRYWAYRLERRKDDSKTKVTLICQTVLNGWIPKCLSNYYMCAVLIHYLITIDNDVRNKKGTGEHQKLMKMMELED